MRSVTGKPAHAGRVRDDGAARTPYPVAVGSVREPRAAWLGHGVRRRTTEVVR